MKSVFQFLCLIFLSIVLIHCKKEDGTPKELQTESPRPLSLLEKPPNNSNGYLEDKPSDVVEEELHTRNRHRNNFNPRLLDLPQRIRDLVPNDILQTIHGFGMPINSGDNPPRIENTYLLIPLILENTNIPNDAPIGTQFANVEIRVYEQNNGDLTTSIDYSTFATNATGLAGFIIGDECSFTIFATLNIMANQNNSSVKSVIIISGSFVNDGIEDTQFALFIIDDSGDVDDFFIDEGQGRVFFDGDNFSNIKGLSRTWHTSLPPCPCHYDDTPFNCPQGTWQKCGTISTSFGDFHHGATYEMRWYPSGGDEPGQQCTYDAQKRLITSGIAAGSADMDSPGGCRSYDSGHISQDVDTWKVEPCWRYLRDWPSNNENACSENIVSGIEHMRTLVGDMTCEDITRVLRVIDEPNYGASQQLIDFIDGNSNQTPVDLRDQLITFKSNFDCALFIKLCGALDQMIQNLN